MSYMREARIGVKALSSIDFNTGLDGGTTRTVAVSGAFIGRIHFEQSPSNKVFITCDLRERYLKHYHMTCLK